ncbi:MAG: hypothetical protein KGJ42_06990, partial [Acidobacteriota bacterium]|nr:hypothetical protein [Acidobacteriota bacterium]
FVPHLLNSMGVRGVMAVMASVSIVGAILTRLALPEPMGQTLEEASAEIFEAPLLDEPSSSHVVTPRRPSDELTH